jgi:hypothetical protein
MTTAVLRNNKRLVTTRITAEAVPKQALADLITGWLYRRAHARIAYWV